MPLLKSLQRFLPTERNIWLPGFIDKYLFPDLCILCDTPKETGSNWFCSECLAKLHKNSQSTDRCPRCSQNQKNLKCACHITWDYPFQSIFSLLDYDENVQEIIRHIKYRGKKNLAYDMAMFALSYTTLTIHQIDYIVPVPLHRRRQNKRGYNQAEWFGKGISSQTGIEVLTDVICRVRQTGTQTKLNRAERNSNMNGVFRVIEKTSEKIRGRCIALVDDVVTTGATTSACTQVLLDAGCSAVHIVSIARD